MKVDFKGCRTRADAVKRHIQFLEHIHEESMRKLETDLLRRASDFESPEDIADALEEAHKMFQEWKPNHVREFADWLDREGIGPER